MRTKIEKRNACVKLICKLLLMGSTASLVALLAPAKGHRLAKVFGRFTRQEIRNLRRTLRRLEKQRLVEMVGQGAQTEIRLTAAGKKKAIRFQLEELTIPRPGHWDGKWRMVVFDIPEYLRLGRDVVRDTLHRLGFYQVQKSVFLFPYPCEEEIEAVARAFEFEKYIHCFTIEITKASYHRRLVMHFGLAK